MLPMQHRSFELHRSRESLVTARLASELSGWPPRIAAQSFHTNQTAAPAPAPSSSRACRTAAGPV